MKIVIIGTGNVATVIGKVLNAAGNEVVQVFGRDLSKARELAEALNSPICYSWTSINTQADLYLVAITDQALYELEQNLLLDDQVVVHTAGSVSIEVLKNVTSNYGVLYPLQSLRKEMPVLTEIPLLVDASNEKTLEKILQLAKEISEHVSIADDETRLKLHVAAVCINNFANHLYEIAEDFCIKEKVDFKLLLPLAEETVQRMEQVSPKQLITGPAIRNDQVTIDRHLDLLTSHPLFQKLYKQMTSSISEFNRTY